MVCGANQAENQDWIGKNIAEIAKAGKKEPLETVFELLISEAGDLGAIYFAMEEADLIQALKHPQSCFGTDAEARRPDGILGKGCPHPRTYGTFPRVLARYVREKGILTLPQAINKMTFQAAQRLGLAKRGKIAPGYWADLVLFDPAEIKDKAEYANPHQFPVGITAVVVNGQPTVWKGELTGKRAGKFLSRKPSLDFKGD